MRISTMALDVIEDSYLLRVDDCLEANNYYICEEQAKKMTNLVKH